MWYHSSRSENDTEIPEPRRREKFPTWSWAGWTGKVMFESGHSSRSLPLYRDGVKSVSIKTQDGVILEPVASSYAQAIHLGDGLDPSPSYLQFHAPLVPPSLFSYDESSTPPSLKVGKLTAKLCLSAGPWDPLRFMASLEEGLSRKCIYWGGVIGTEIVMVLESQGSGSWSRVGLMLFEDLYSKPQFLEIWSGTRRWGPDFDRWESERPTAFFTVI